MNSYEEMPLWNNQTLIIECEDKEIFYTQIIRMEDNHVLIQYPVNKSNVPMNLLGEKRVTVYLYNNQKERYMFCTSLQYDNKKVFFTMPAANSIQKVQRRHYFRVPAVLQIWLDLKTQGKCRFMTDDVSGGGISFLCPDPLEENEVVIGGIFMDAKHETKEIGFRARIVNIRRDTNVGRRVAMEFIDMKEAHRSKIIQYCNDRQIEIRNKIYN